MKKFSEFLEEEIVKRWENTGLLVDGNDKRRFALCLESQRLHNENSNAPARFMRLSIPMLVRTLQAVPDLLPCYGDPGSKWVNTGVPLSVVEGSSLDAEAEMCAEASRELKTFFSEALSAKKFTSLRCLEWRDGMVWANVE